MAPERLGPYRILDALGRGGMGTVYLAEVDEPVPGRERGDRVALKVIHHHLLERPGFLRRFQREATIGRRIDHENVVRIFDLQRAEIEDRGEYYLVMEYVEGKTLRELLRDLGRFPEALLREVARQITAGLAAIHAGGVIHRDLKPENILITDDHHVRIMDLGVARPQDGASAITEAGQFAGSMGYAAPEQFQNLPVQASADLYGLGVLLYELATGKNPFRADSAAKVIQAHLSLIPPLASERNPDLSAFICDVLAMLLAKEAEARFPSAAALCDVLQRGERSTWWAEREARVLQTRQSLPRIPVSRDTKLHGRESELAVLRDAWQEARMGRGRTILLEGEAGIGKTRLVDAFAVDPGGGETQVLYGAYSPSGGMGGLSDAILDHFGHRDLEGALPPFLEATPTLLPAFAALVRHESPPTGADPLRMEALHAVMVNLMRGLADRVPLLWIVDDVQFAGPDSRRVILSMARAVKRHAVLLIVCTRPGLPDEEMGHFTRLETTQRLQLGRLSPRQVIELLQESFHSESLAEKLGGKIAYKSDGVPFFVFELIRGLQEGRFIEARGDGTFIETRVVDDIEVPSAVRDLLVGRLEDLRDDERDLLDAASVQGLEFDGDLLARVSERKRIEILQRLAAIDRRTQLVRASGDRWRFDHHQLQEVIYQDLAESLRREYHALLAEAFTAREGVGDATARGLPAEKHLFLASHLLRGRDPRAGLPHLLPALKHLGASYRNEAAVDLGRRALGIDGLLTGADRVEILLVLSSSLNALGLREDERAVLDEAESRTRDGPSALLRARVHQARASLLYLMSRIDDAKSAYAEALACAREAGDTRQEARAEGGLGNVCAQQERYEEAARHYEQSETLSREIGDRVTEAICAGNQGIVCFHLERIDEARALYERQLAICREEGVRVSEAVALGNLGILIARQGDKEEAREYMEKALAIHRETGNRRGEAWARLTVGSNLRDQGRHREAMAQIEHSLDLARDIADLRTQTLALAALGTTCLNLGRFDAAREHLDQQLALSRETGSRRGEVNALHNLAERDLAMGHLDEAVRGMENVLVMQRELGQGRSLVTSLVALAGMQMQAGDDEAARTCLEEALEIGSPDRDRDEHVLALARLAQLDPSRLAEARRALRESRVWLRNEIRTSVHWLLWRAGGDTADLEAAHRLVENFCRNAPEDDWTPMLENVPLYRDVEAAWRAHEGG